ncbi:MAG TPA: aminotransferase class I/II-fold pyridoxal phosphate-dependent enzyme [Polyangiaceae bacterium]
MSSFEESLGEELARLEREGLLRAPDDGALRRQVVEAAAGLGLEPIDASSNNYLALAELDVSRETSVQVGGATAGAGASRLIHGTRALHLALEQALARWVRRPAALLFTSGYAANVGLISALSRPGAAIFSDELNHASIIDGCRLGRAQVVVTPHLNLLALEQALAEHRSAVERVVVTESYFSMDGDGPDLAALRQLCDEHDARLIVDEAHALGVFGEEGAGRCALAGIAPDALVGALGKAVGVQGAFVAGSERLRTLLWNRARSFVFSTATSPLLAERALFHVERTRAADDRRRKLEADTADLRGRLEARDIRVLPGSFGPIVPVLIGANQRAVDVANALAQHGILTQAIRPPTVPDGTARLRVTVTTGWPRDGAARIAEAIATALGRSGPSRH